MLKAKSAKTCRNICSVHITLVTYGFIISSINKHILIGTDAYPLESIKLHIAWFAGRDVTKHMARGNIAWLKGSLYITKPIPYLLCLPHLIL